MTPRKFLVVGALLVFSAAQAKAASMATSPAVITYFNVDNQMINFIFILENRTSLSFVGLNGSCPVRLNIVNKQGKLVYGFPAKNVGCPSVAEHTTLPARGRMVVYQIQVPSAVLKVSKGLYANAVYESTWKLGNKTMGQYIQAQPVLLPSSF